MAKRTAVVVDQEPEDTAEVVLPTGEIPEETGEEDALAELRGLGAGGDHKYTVSRVSSEPGKKAGYCKTYAVGDLSLDTIREEFGGGKYRIRVTDPQGKYVTMTTVDIVDLPKPAQPAAAPAVAPGADLSGIAALLAAVKPNAPTGDGGLAQIMTVMMAQQKATTDMIIALMNKPAPTGPSLTDLLALIKAEKGEKTDPVALLLQGLELGKSIAGGGGETGMLDVAKQGLELITPLVQQRMETPAPAAPARRLAAPPAPAAPPPVAATATDQPVQPAPEGANVKVIQQLQWLKAQLNVLVHHAVRGKTPALYAEVMLDNLPPFVTVEDIHQHIGADDALDNLAKIDARVLDHREWFEDFREAVVEFLSPEEDEQDGDDPHDPTIPTGAGVDE